MSPVGGENAPLGEQSLATFSAAFRAAVADPRVRTIVVTAPDGSFLSGADVRFFAHCLAAGELDRLLEFTRAGQQLLNEIQQCTKLVVAWVRGPAMGAGLELALACHKIVASPRAKFALPETGLGIYPGLGGTQRTPRRIGPALAKWMIFTGAILSAEHAAQIGLIDVVSEVNEIGDAIAAARTSPERAAVPTARPVRFAALEEFFATHNVAALVDPSFPLPTDAQLARVIVQVRSKAPIALRLVEQIIDAGLSRSLEAGLDLEFAHLQEVLSTEDARAGLSSLGTQRVTFSGR